MTFPDILKMDQYLPDIQEALRLNGFPGFEQTYDQQLKTFVVQGGVPKVEHSQETVWEMSNPQQTRSFILRKNSLALQVTDYQHFEDFIAAFLLGAQVVNQTAKIGGMTRLGIRYIDLLLGTPELPIRTQLEPGLLGLAGKHQTPWRDQVVQLEQTWSTPQGQMVFRCVHGENVQGLRQLIGPVKLDFGRFEGPTGAPEAMLDYDHFMEFSPPLVFDLDELSKQLTDLHQGTSEAFKDSLTEAALNHYQ